MMWMICVWIVLFCLWALPSHATVLDPWAVTSLGTSNASKLVNIDAGVLDPVSGVGIFTFNDITGANLSIFGTPTAVARDQIDLRGTIDAGSRLLRIIAAENMTLSGEARIANISLSSGRDLIVPGAGITGRTVNLGSGIVTLSGGTVSGSAIFGVSAISSAGVIIGSAGATFVAPVPVPAAFLLFATGLAAVGLVKRRKFSGRTLA